MVVIEFLRRLFSVIFAFIFGILLLLLVFVIFVIGFFNEENIHNHINSLDIFETKQEKILQHNNDATIGEQISNDLYKLGIPKDVTNDILESDGLDIIVSKYMFDYVEYILFYRDMPILSSIKIIKTLDYEGVKFKNGELTQKQNEIIDNYIINIVGKVNSQIPTNQDIENMGYDSDLIKLVSSIIFAKETLAIIIMCLVLMILLIGLCCMNFSRTLRNVSIPILVSGIIVVIISMIEVKFMNVLINGDGIVEGMILKIVNETFKDLFVYGLALVVIGIILLIIVAILVKNQKKELKVYNQPINEKRSQVQENLKNHIALSDEDIDKIDNTLLNRKNEIENIELPSVSYKESDEKINISTEGELPKIDIVSDVLKEEIQEVKPILLEDKKSIENIEHSDNFIDNDIQENFDEEIKVIDVENRDERIVRDDFYTDNISYFELEEKEEEFVKKEIDIKPLENIEIKITSPVKGKDIMVDLEKSEEKEEEIELL